MNGGYHVEDTNLLKHWCMLENTPDIKQSVTVEFYKRMQQYS